MQTATNPQTGETAVLVDGAWAKADRVASNDKGEKAYLVGGKWLTSEGAADLPTPTKRSLAEDIARQVGLTVRAGVGGVTALPNMLGDALGLKSTEAVQGLMTKAGLPVPEGGTERVAQDVASAMAGGGGVAKVAQMSAPASQTGQAIAQMLSQNMGAQTAAAAAGSGAAGVTREMGGGAGSQLAAGLIAGVGAPMAVQMAANVPGRVLARSINKAAASPNGQEGARVARETGIELTPGTETGSKLVLNLENAARQNGLTADRVQDVDLKIANQAIKRVEDIANTITKRTLDPADLGTRIEDTVKAAATRLDNVRSSLADRDYARVRAAAGDQPAVKLDNFSAELKKIAEEYAGVPGADAQKIAAQAMAALGKVSGVVEKGVAARVITTPIGKEIKISGRPDVTGTLDKTIDEALKARSFYGKAAKGNANVFEDVAPSLNRMIGARLFRAVNADFDAAAQNSEGGLRKALDTANGNYKRLTQSLEFLEKSALGKMVGDDLTDAAFAGVRASTTAGESIVQKINTMHPSTRKASLDIIRRYNPELVDDVKVGLIRDALDKGMSIPPSTKGASSVPISFNKFVSALGGEKTGFAKQLESYGFKPEEIQSLKDVVAAMTRAGDKSGFNFSNTNVQGDTMKVAGAIGDAATGNVAGFASKALSIGGKYIGLNKIAAAMADPNGRKALITLSSPKASPQAVMASFETVEGPSSK